MKKSSVFLLSFLSGILFISTASVAEDLQIINKTKEDLLIEITPEGKPKEVLPGINKTIPSKDESTLMITHDDLKGKKFFSIKKADGDFAGLSRCAHLSVKKIYTVVFEKHHMGVTCTATVTD